MKLEGSCHYGAVATKDHPSADYPYKNADGGNHPARMPRRR